MYTCAYTRTHFTYVRTRTYTHTLHVRTRTYTCTHCTCAYTYVHTHTACAYTYVHMHTLYMCVHIRTHTHCMCVHVRTHAHTVHVRTRTCTHCTCVHMCVHVRTHAHATCVCSTFCVCIILCKCLTGIADLIGSSRLHHTAAVPAHTGTSISIMMGIDRSQRCTTTGPLTRSLATQGYRQCFQGTTLNPSHPTSTSRTPQMPPRGNTGYDPLYCIHTSLLHDDRVACCMCTYSMLTKELVSREQAAYERLPGHTRSFWRRPHPFNRSCVSHSLRH